MCMCIYIYIYIYLYTYIHTLGKPSGERNCVLLQVYVLTYIQSKNATLTALHNSITNINNIINSEIQNLQTEITVDLRSISEVSSCFFGPRPWHIEIRHRVKRNPQLVRSDLRLSN